MKFHLRLIILLIIATIEIPALIKLDKKVYKFDPGISIDKSDNEIIPLTIEDLYDDEKGYGWIIQPEYEFYREELSRYRNKFTIDGVTGKNLSFKADLIPGEWFVTVWIEAGVEDSTTTQITINNNKKDLNWQIFNPPAEPRNTIQKVYRIFNSKIFVKDNFEISFESVSDSIRLLGLTLIQASENHQDILNEIKDAGHYNSTNNFEKIKIKLQDILSENPDDPFALHWIQQINLLLDGEQLVQMGGWEWSTKKTGLGLFDKFHQAVMIFDALLSEKNLLYDRALWNRGTLLYWLDKERGGQYEETSSIRDLEELYEKFPGDELIAMYNGEKIKSASSCDTLTKTSNAPQWSLLQREALCRLKDEIQWWVNVKQADNGELGGKFGDDVEILRGWSPAILTGDTIALKGWKKLADGVWDSELLYKGYAKDPDDVEHSSEFISDTTPELVFFTDDEKYIERLRYSTNYFSDFWTGIADNGKRYFKSAWFSSTAIDTIPPKNRDVEMNTRAAKAVRYYAWKTGDEEAIKLLHQWSSGWVNAAMNVEKGKPIGIIPASVSFPSAEINGDEKNWYDANMYWHYFDWIYNAGSKMYDQLLFTYQLTQDSTLNEPLINTLNLIQKYEGNPTIEERFIEGSNEWAVNILRKEKDFWNSVEQYRFNTFDKRFDRLILKYGTPYSSYRLTGEIKFVEEALQNFLDDIRFNKPLRTSEVLHTDRVDYPGVNDIKAMLTGDGTNEGASPYYFISWENTDDNFSALVDETGNDKLRVQIFSHSNTEDEITMRLWQLKKGYYSLEVYDNNEKLYNKKIEIEKRGQRVRLKIPPKQLIQLEIKST